MSNSTVIFDVESGPLPEHVIRPLLKPVESPANYKDEAKIQAYIEEAQAKQMERAALSAVTGRVLCIGWMEHPGGAAQFIEDKDERTLLAKFWDLYADYRVAQTWIGFNIYDFDLPFLVRRSMVHGVIVPLNVRQGRYWNSDRFTDLMEVWTCCLKGDDHRISLDTLGKCLGVGGKTGKGADFARLWETQRETAKDYLANDLGLTSQCATKLIG